MLSCIRVFICGEHWKVVFSMEFESARAAAVIIICGGGNGAVVIIGSYASITTLDSMLLVLLPWGDEFWKD